MNNIVFIISCILFVYLIVSVVIVRNRIYRERDIILNEVMKYLNKYTNLSEFDKGMRFTAERLMYFINRLD